MTNPCSEQWDNMQPDGAGRYCDSCEKHVLDLTAKSDAELIQFFKKKKDNICGRLLSSQLNRELTTPVPKATWHWLLPLTMGAIAIKPTHASELRPAIAQNDQVFSSSKTLMESNSRPTLPAVTITGKVVDDRTGKPLRGVKVKQKGFENVLAITDSTGRFEFNVAEEILTMPFTFELSGYSRIESGLNDGMVIKLAIERRIMVGGISSVTLNQAPLYVVYVGKKSCSIDNDTFKEIKPEWINKVDVLKDAAATSVYGIKGANGVILIEIKKAYENKIDFSKKKQENSRQN